MDFLNTALIFVIFFCSNVLLLCICHLLVRHQNSRDQQKRSKYDEESQLQVRRNMAEADRERKTILNNIISNWRLAANTFPQNVRDVVDKECTKIADLNMNDEAYKRTKSYVECLLSVPWTKTTHQNLDLQHARQILDQNHHGMENVKEWVLGFITLRKLAEASSMVGKTCGKILCLEGPPGTGKTSMAQSIASALGRKFEKWSLRVQPEPEDFSGEGRLYLGAKPSNIIQILIQLNTMDPVILLDDIDHMTSKSTSSSLLEVIDPEQNHHFLDQYLKVAVDLSKILFIITAVDTTSLPWALRNRMKIIEMPSHNLEDKIKIARAHLIPNILQRYIPLTQDKGGRVKVDFEEDAIRTLIDDYGDGEAWVRRFQNLIEQILGKVAPKIVDQNDATEIKIDTHNLEQYVGKKVEVLLHQLCVLVTPPGVTLGLATTGQSGRLQYYETSLRWPLDTSDERSDQGSLEITGQMESVMTESAQIAYTFAKNFLYQQSTLLGKKLPNFLHKAHIHLHAPDGATSKMGPSGGIAMATALISLALGKSVRPGTAMTGEISLTGKVLPVGGIGKKIGVAKKVKVIRIFLPASNRKNVEEMAGSLTEGLEFIFVNEYAEIFDLAF